MGTREISVGLKATAESLATAVMASIAPLPQPEISF